MKLLEVVILTLCGLFFASEIAAAADARVPEAFQGHDESSRYAFNYDDLSALLGMLVADVGRSDRQKADPSHAKTGTRLKSKVNRATINEGNRFYFETFVDDEKAKRMLNSIQKNLEQSTARVPLEKFSRDEQLAFWLNLYNATVLNEIVKVYPQRDLEKMLHGKDSIFSAKLLSVQGVPLSLNDIQFTILKQNYDSNPLVLYGLFQGIIGGPNIRRQAYTGADVHAALKENAIEFINSNRGTIKRGKKRFRVSSFYERNSAYFPNFQEDLTAHLMEFLEGPERMALQAGPTLKPDIDDWTVADLGGSGRVIGGSFSDSSAALMGSVSSSSAASVSSSTAGVSNSQSGGGVNSALLRQVQEKKDKAAGAEEDDSDESESGAESASSDKN